MHQRSPSCWSGSCCCSGCGPEFFPTDPKEGMWALIMALAMTLMSLRSGGKAVAASSCICFTNSVFSSSLSSLFCLLNLSIVLPPSACLRIVLWLAPSADANCWVPRVPPTALSAVYCSTAATDRCENKDASGGWMVGVRNFSFFLNSRKRTRVTTPKTRPIRLQHDGVLQYSYQSRCTKM